MPSPDPQATIDELRRVAGAATPRHWIFQRPAADEIYANMSDCSPAGVYVTTGEDEYEMPVNAIYIAKMDPAVGLALADLLEQTTWVHEGGWCNACGDIDGHEKNCQLKRLLSLLAGEER